MSWPGSEHAQSSPRAITPANPMKLNHGEVNSFPRSKADVTGSSPPRLGSSPHAELLHKLSMLIPLALEDADDDAGSAASRISAYARLDFEDYTFFVQTLQVVLGRNSNEEIQSSQHSVDVHLGSKKAISRRHAKIFYNFGTQQFEISIMGRNGAFVDDLFVEKGITLPLVDGTKVQIGDIPFTFVLPSIEPSEENEKKQKPGQLINPSDAINLRTNLYLTSTSPHREKKKVTLPAEPRKELARRNSKADIVRRLSTARRKSNATTNDEINALLKELEELEGDNDEDFDPTSLDEEVRELLLRRNSKALTQEQLDQEEDEIDELVKQHNLQQGVSLSETDPVEPKLHVSKLAPDLDIDINILDQEIASLAPLIDAHNEGLGDDKDSVKDLDERKKVQASAAYPYQSKYGLSATGNAPYYDSNTDPALLRTAPLMGRPAVGPRMGKPATIQPPANRVYGRQPAVIGQSMSSYPGSYQMGTPNYSAYGTYMGTGASGNAMYNPILTRLPPPKLEVLVETISRVPATNSIIPFRAITSTLGSFEKAPICVFKSIEPSPTAPKIPVRRKDGALRRTPRVQSYKEIPEQFKNKPAVSVLAMIMSVLKPDASGKKSLTLSDIQDAVKEMFPYYKFCPDGWQPLVSHNVRFNQVFKRVSKAGLESEWLWELDEDYLLEKEKTRKRQQELAMAKAKEAALKAVELRQRQRLDVPQYSAIGRTYMGHDSSFGSGLRYPVPGAGVGMSTNGYGLQRPKSIAELASEIKREGTYAGGKTPAYFQRQVPGVASSGDSNMLTPELERLSSGTTIKDQLAANRARPSVPLSVTKVVNPPSKLSSPPHTTSPSLPAMNADTKKSLTYLQKELFTLYKARKLSYSTAVTTEIITKALATTIAQVNIIGSKAGCGDNALSFLVEKAPQQVSKILDIALTKSIKENQGIPTSKPPSRDATPQPTLQPSPTTHPSPVVSKTSLVSDATGGRVESPRDTVASPTYGSKHGSVLSKPPSFVGSGLSRPAFSGKPQGFSKPGALTKPPQFISNKPRLPEKRPADTGAEGPSKLPKLSD